MDARAVLSHEGNEDYIIDIALIKRALKIQSEQKVEEIKVLAELIGLEVAKTIAKIF
jgi:hypothetical protein